MKLLVAIPYYPPHLGGMEKHTERILQGLKNNFGYDIAVVTSNHNFAEYVEEIREGIKIYRLPAQFLISNTPVSWHWKNLISRIVDKERPEVINGRGPVPFIADVACAVAREKKIPFVLGWHFPTMKKGSLLLDPLILAYESIFLNQMLKSAAAVSCSSPLIKETLFYKFRDKTEVITQGVDGRTFRKLDVPRQKYSLLFAGNFETEVKGLKYLIQTIAILRDKYPEIRLTVAGSGRTGEYTNLAKKLGIEKRIIFMGVMNGEQLTEEYNRNEIFVCPSTAENFPSTILEAMMCGTPVVATAVGAIPMIVKDGITGLLARPKSPASLAEKIDWLWRHPHEAGRMVKTALTAVSAGFSWEQQVTKTHLIFSKVQKHDVY